MRGSSVERAASAAFAEAVAQFAAGRLSLADKALRRLLGIAPGHAEGLNLQGVVRLRLGRPAEAAESFAAATAAAPDHAPYHSNLGAALQRARRPAEAEAAFARAIALAPDLPELPFNRAAALKELGRLEEAAACYERALALRPDYPEASHNLATTLEALGRLEAAEAACRRALARRPDWAEAQYTLGLILNRGLRAAEALACFGRAVALKPDYPEALTRQAGLLLFFRRFAEAEPVARRAAALRPGDAETLGYHGWALRELGRPAEAIALLDRAIALDPDAAEARLERLIATLPILPMTAEESAAAPHAFGQALAALEAWAETNLPALGRIVGRLQPFELAYRPGDITPPLARHARLMARAAAVALPTPALGARPRRSRLRLGIVTAQARRHPVWDVILKGIVGGLDRRRFEVLVYHTRPDTDAETAWARAQTDAFAQGPLTVPAWIARIAEDRPDTLLYPEIGMDPVAFALATQRLAPLQAASWGHPVTTGLPEMDLYLSGELLEGADADAHYTERLARLPGTGVLTTLPAVAAEPADPALDLPEDRGIARIVLPHMPHKLDPVHDALVAAAARAAAPCRIWLPRAPDYPWATQRLLGRLGAALAAEGLEAKEVLRVFAWQSPGRFLGLLDAMDLYLDAPGFSGYTTAWAAAHRGLPIVTLEGKYLRQRLAAGLLRRIELGEIVATTGADYVARAGALAAEARDPARRAARRAAIRAAAPLADGDTAPIRALEDVLEAALRERGA